MNIQEMVREAQDNISFCICLIIFYPIILTRNEFISLIQGLPWDDKRKIAGIWLRIYPEDFKTKLVSSFFLSIEPDYDEMQKLISIFSKKYVYTQDTNIKLLDDVKQITRHMCSIDSSIFEKIKGRDYFIDISRGIQENVLYFNRLSAWITTLVLKEITPRNRARIIEYFIQVCLELRKVGNFNSLFSIIAALNSTAVCRLKETKKLISLWNRKKLKELEIITRGDRNWKAYKSILKSTNRPVIPYLGVFLRDLTVLKELVDKIDSETYNTPKLVKMSEIALGLMELRSDEFTRVNHSCLLNLLCQSEIYDQDMAYNISKELEP